jgi:hypothetical protein
MFDKYYLAYHYISYGALLKNFVDTSGGKYKILPISYISDSAPHKKEILKMYADRARQKKLSNTGDDKIDSEALFKHSYDTWFKDVIGKEYKHYGIYFTPVDFFNLFPNGEYSDAEIRVNIDLKNRDLSNWAVNWVNNGRREIIKLTDLDYDNLGNQFSDPIKLKKILDKSPALKYKYLPQIVSFDDSVPFTKKNVESRKKS